jgi:predicted nuclease of predicted toxin-antitoxin system
MVIVTKDENFSRRATLPEAQVQVLWVRLGNCRTVTLLTAFGTLLEQMLDALDSGARLVEIR